MKIKKLISAFIFIIIIIFTGCSDKKDEKKIIIAEQYGLAYAPIQIMRLEKKLEKKLPGWRIEWKKLSNTAAIREAMLSDNLDIGFMGLPPFLIGFDRGMEWKMFTGLCEAPIGLVTWNKNINSIADFSKKDRIALPQPGSIQHILLTMAAEKLYGNSSVFDNRIVTLSHPDGMNALLSKKDITAHFTSPPFIMKELEEPGFKLVLTGKEAMGGDFTFIGGTVKDSFAAKYPAALKTLNSVLDETIKFIKVNPDKAAELLSPVYNIPEEDLKKYLTWEGMNFSREINGMKKFIDFMKRNNYLENEITEKDIFY
jgi:NitT/TauT family transport system substrate-binding protein